MVDSDAVISAVTLDIAPVTVDSEDDIAPVIADSEVDIAPVMVDSEGYC